MDLEQALIDWEYFFMRVSDGEFFFELSKMNGRSSAFGSFFSCEVDFICRVWEM